MAGGAWIRKIKPPRLRGGFLFICVLFANVQFGDPKVDVLFPKNGL